METTPSNLEIKLTQLRMNLEKTDFIIGGDNLEAMERHPETLKTIAAKLKYMRLEVEVMKLAAGKDVTEIGAWNASMDEKLQQAYKEIAKLHKWLEERKRETPKLPRNKSK